jgi:hypothetical protein
MKVNLLVAIVALTVIVTVASLVSSRAADSSRPGAKYEYATIRWGGPDNTHVIRPGGEIEFVGPQLRQIKRPDRSNDRSLYMNVVMNGMAEHGWEFGGSLLA